jgi:hypothetical protein
MILGLLALIVLSGTIFILILSLGPRRHISLETFQQIQAGMTVKDVELLIGLSPGNYCTVGLHSRDGDMRTWGGGGTKCRCWESDYGNITIWCDDECKVTGADFQPFHSPSFGFRILSWLGN